ncbi:MAG: PDZ domain-containing protein, partial [Gallionella sp.]|nr:PDZ domain-containing protein [Gallionella sp.]
VVLWRKGALKELTVVVMAIPEDARVVAAVKRSAEDEFTRIDRLGIAVSELSNEQLAELKINGGLLVEEVRGAVAHVAGLQRGDVLLAVGNMPIRSLKQFDELIRKFPVGRNVALLVRRGENVSYIAIKLDEK